MRLAEKTSRVERRAGIEESKQARSVTLSEHVDNVIFTFLACSKTVTVGVVGSGDVQRRYRRRF